MEGVPARHGSGQAANCLRRRGDERIESLAKKTYRLPALKLFQP